MPGLDVQRTAATSLTTAAAAAATVAAAVALGFTSLADAQNLSPPTTACPQGLDGPIYTRGQSCYQFNGNDATWTDARSLCHQRNGRLVAVTDSGLQSWLSDTASTLWPNEQGVWLGLSRVSNTFVWDGYDDTAQTGNYFNWMSGFPTSDPLGLQNCVYMRRSYNWSWANIVCDRFTTTYNYLCEYPVVYTNITTASRLPVTNGTSTPSPTGMGTDTTASSVTEYYSTTSRGFVNQTADNATATVATRESLLPSTSHSATANTVADLSTVWEAYIIVLAVSCVSLILSCTTSVVALSICLSRRCRSSRQTAGSDAEAATTTAPLRAPAANPPGKPVHESNRVPADSEYCSLSQNVDGHGYAPLSGHVSPAEGSARHHTAAAASLSYLQPVAGSGYSYTSSPQQLSSLAGPARI